jgi:peptide/nickel transport system ATP-binding protein/oligopeptide transport system ATP-binding protein
MAETLLEVKDLSTYFYTEEGTAKAVDGVDFEIGQKEVLGLAGESACGKTVTALSILRLVPAPGRIVSGQILYRGEDLLKYPEDRMRKIRGREISMVFQEPATSLNPVFTVGNQIIETLILHQELSRREARNKAVQMLDLVGIPSPESRIYDYPHNLSGGMAQRVMTAMALACNPSLLIADEPTTALDVTIQAQILELLKELQDRFGMSILLITHNLGIIAQVSDRLAIMYAGKVVEYGKVDRILKAPAHPYTLGLLDSIPRVESVRSRLSTIKGMVPRPVEWPSGCRFHPRCKYATPVCKEEEPEMLEVAPGHRARCHLTR